jgi:pyruvate/2-oxoglutarate dehydrogenase complex dihydrolipoamide dehydrogenase (E3) component
MYLFIISLIIDGITFAYDKVCICTGSLPKLIHNHPNIIGLKDIRSVNILKSKLTTNSKIVLVGNGGIALELVKHVSYTLL